MPSFDVEEEQEEWLHFMELNGFVILKDVLTQEECENADLAGWVSKSSDIWWFGEYGYPVSSGMIGWRYILELSEDFGIPTTQYVVSKDINLFKKKDEALFTLSKELVDEGLVEIGAHTKSHVKLDKIPYAKAMSELSDSKKELEILYNTTIFGFRNPYLALVEGNSAKNEQALAKTSYTYYSLYGDHTKSISTTKL